MAPKQSEKSSRVERETLLSSAVLTELGSAIICIDPLSNTITGSNDAAGQIFGFDPEAAETQPWWKTLGAKKRHDHPLNYALEAGVRIAFPPTVLTRRKGEEVVVCGLVIPKIQLGSAVSLIVMRELLNPEIYRFGEEVGKSDTVAVLGVDRLTYGPGWDVDDSSRFLMDLRSSLLEIARAEDVVSLPSENTISMILRGIGVEESHDVTNAFLSHLRSVPQHYGAGALQARFSIGLASRKKYPSSLQALVGANDAMLCAQLGAMPQRIKVASKWDKNQLCGSNFSSDGVFADNVFSEGYRLFRQQLTTLPLSANASEDYLAAIVQLTLQQPGVKRLGIFRKRKDGSYRYLAAGEKKGEQCVMLDEDSLGEAFTREARNPKLDLLRVGNHFRPGKEEMLQALVYRQTVLGHVAIVFDRSQLEGDLHFSFDTGALSFLADRLPGLKKSPDAPEMAKVEGAREATPLDTQIEGYVVDNMEGAVDQATFLARIDIPVAIVGPRGTGKMYIAKIIHQESGGAEGMIVQVDCREFRNREEAVNRIARLLERSEGKTLVFKSPHLMSPDAQVKLARQISTRTLADVKPARYLPRAKYVALFPDALESLVQHHGLSEKLASVFAGYPINVPSVKDRKQAVLRWAHKILGQESAAHERPVKGFTPDAEQALLSHDWPGNISEMRQCIVGALERTDKDWITPVDLGIFKGITAEGTPSPSDSVPFLSLREMEESTEEEFSSTALEALDAALGEAVNIVAQEQSTTPLGAWLEDDLILAVTDRYQGDAKLSAEFLHTKPRNISRWMPKIAAREEERNSSPVWRTPRRFIGEWVRETPHLPEPPQQILLNMLASHVDTQCATASIATRAKIMAVSIPTYQKRLQLALDLQDIGSG